MMLAICSGHSLADGVAVAEKEEEKPQKIEFSPEAEKKFATFLEKVKEAKMKLWQTRVEEEIGAIQKATNLDARGVATLKAAGPKAIDESAAAWLPAFDQYFRKILKNTPARASAFLDQGIVRAQFYASFQPVKMIQPSPVGQPSWSEALEKALNAEQHASWSRALAEKAQAEDAEIDQAVKGMKDNFLDGRRTKGLRISAEIAKALSLSKERAQALDDLARAAAEKSAEDWATTTREIIRASNGQRRKNLLSLRMTGPGDEIVDQLPIWKEGLVKILTPLELEKLENEKSSRAARRFRTIGLMMLAELDPKVAFTADQRERLQPVVEKAAKSVLNGLKEEQVAVYIQSQALLEWAGKVKQEEVASILDASQWKHWKDACDPAAIEESTRQPQPWKTGQPVPDDGGKAKEPEVVENEVSDFMLEKSTKAHKAKLQVMLLRAEDAARVVGLTPESRSHLRTAACGAADAALESWKTSAYSTVRSQIKDANPQNVRQRLGGIDEDFEDRSDLPPKCPLWENAVKSEMTAEQQVQWKTAIDERAAFRHRSIANWIIVEFERLASITEEQGNTLRPIVEKIAVEYEPELHNSVGSSDSWYLQEYSLFIPVAGIPEKELKAVITKEQWDIWMSSEVASNALSFWGNIQQNHLQRLRQNQQQ